MKLTQSWIDTQRAYAYRRQLDRRVTTIEQAEAFIDEVGFAFFWPIKKMEAPNLFEAIAGRSRTVPNAHDDPDLSKCWGWKDQSLGGSRWYYAKLLRRKATMIAPRLWSTFYALTNNYGDLNDYLEQVHDGLMTHEARLIYEALLAHGPLNTVELRRKTHLSSSANKSRFERALIVLQVDMKVLPVAVAEAGAWRYSFVYDIAMRHHPQLPQEARQITTQAAWETLVRQYVENAVAVTTKQITQLFHVYEPAKRDLMRALEALIERGAIQAGQIEGDGEVWVSSRALNEI